MALTFKKVINSLIPFRRRKRPLVVSSESLILSAGEDQAQGPYGIFRSNNLTMDCGNKSMIIMNETGIWLNSGKGRFVSLESLSEVLSDGFKESVVATKEDLELLKKRNKDEHS